ncbi:transcriptional regulator [Pseudomonas mangiferae]|uniref:Transcriptional regulator n=2 Tax=Pseudomonas mangiferae TaxID=2593654 RepID=A0A553H4A7_9PSED|nr:transcriptional regulator [Pseudomonas mangiferae]
MGLGQLLMWDAYFFSVFAQARNLEEFSATATSAVRDLGFDYYAYGMCSTTPFMRPKTYLYSNYSSEWIYRYQTMNYAVVDPTVKHSKVSSVPILWSDELFKGCPDLWTEARDSDLRHGLAQPSFNERGRVGILSLARRDRAISPKEFEDLKPATKAFASAAHEKLSELEREAGVFSDDVEFTGRERDILLWTADGKTSEEIGVILGVCTDTINYHLKNVQRKIGANNRVQAVSYAVALGYI